MRRMTQERILVVVAHPDDEILGCGGAIARHIEAGDTVATLILGEGIASRADVAKGEISRHQRELQKAAHVAQEILGAPEPILRQLPDNQFDTVSLLSVIHEIEAVCKDVSPTLIYTHHAGDVNVDHRIVSQAIDAVARPMEGNSVKEVRAFEVPSSSEWNFTRDVFRPNIFVSLTEEQLKKKIAAMRCYTSEIREFPHPRSAKYLEALARVRGGQSGAHAAEAFALVYRRV